MSALARIPLSRPHLVLEPVTPATLPEWMTLTNRIFSTPLSNGDPPFLSIFYPDGITPTISAWATSIHAAALPSDKEHYYMVRDLSLPSAPAIATTRFVDVPASSAASRAEADRAAAAQRDIDAADPVPGVDYRVFEHFRPAQTGGVARVVGDRAHTYLKILAVAPERQGQGVGGCVLRWLTARAVERGEPVYLESSGFGVPAYTKVGFRDCGYIDFDARRFGADFAFKHLAMVWEPEDHKV